MIDPERFWLTYGVCYGFIAGFEFARWFYEVAP